MPVDEQLNYETMQMLAKNARMQTPHIKPDEWRDATALVRRLREEGRRLDGLPATSNIYGVMPQRMTASVSVPGKPRTMEELISKFKREAGYGRDAKTENPGEHAGDTGETAREACGDGEAAQAAGGDRERGLSDRKAGNDDYERSKPKRSRGRQYKLTEEQRAEVVKEYLGSNKTCVQIAAERGVHWHTIEDILKKAKNERGETASVYRERLRRERIIEAWKNGTPNGENAKREGVSRSWVLKVIETHCKLEGAQNDGGDETGGDPGRRAENV